MKLSSSVSREPSGSRLSPQFTVSYPARADRDVYKRQSMHTSGDGIC